MTVLFTDSFTVGADTNIDAHPAGTPNWAYCRGSTSNLRILAADDRVSPNSNGATLVARCTAVSALADQKVTAVCDALVNPVYGGLAVRYSDTTRGYLAQVETSQANELRIREDNAGITLLASADRGLTDGTHNLEFSAVGPADNTLLTFTVDGGTPLTFTDTTAPATGRPGISSFRTTGSPAGSGWIDDFAVDDLVTGIPDQWNVQQALPARRPYRIVADGMRPPNA